MGIIIINSLKNDEPSGMTGITADDQDVQQKETSPVSVISYIYISYTVDIYRIL